MKVEEMKSDSVEQRCYSDLICIRVMKYSKHRCSQQQVHQKHITLSNVLSNSFRELYEEFDSIHGTRYFFRYLECGKSTTVLSLIRKDNLAKQVYNLSLKLFPIE